MLEWFWTNNARMISTMSVVQHVVGGVLSSELFAFEGLSSSTGDESKMPEQYILNLVLPA